MRREGVEEAGVSLDWQPTVVLVCPDVYACHFFAGYIGTGDPEPRTQPAGDEPNEYIESWLVRDVVSAPDLIVNLRWIIPLSADLHTLPGVRLAFPIKVFETLTDAEAHRVAVANGQAPTRV